MDELADPTTIVQVGDWAAKRNNNYTKSMHRLRSMIATVIKAGKEERGSEDKVEKQSWDVTPKNLHPRMLRSGIWEEEISDTER